MDQFMVDVTDIPDVKIGDAVTLLGKDGDETITMEQLGELSGRFNYEFACLITPRVPRIYHKTKKCNFKNTLENLEILLYTIIWSVFVYDYSKRRYLLR